MTLQMREALNRQSDQELVELALQLETQIKELRTSREVVGLILTERLNERGAREIPHETIECKLQYPAPQYDYGKLAALRELLPIPVIKEAWRPQHQETITVMEKWDARKFKGWGKKCGDDVQAVIDRAAIPGTPRLVVKEK